MDKKDIIIKNGTIGFLSQIISQLIQFVIRILTLCYIGIEILGISSTCTSILNTLSLTELGFQTAVVYFLYEPIKSNDSLKINKLMAILKKVYVCIGSIFIGISIIGIPFLKYILNGILVTNEIIVYYVIMSLNVAASYFFSYKRALLYADQKEYISNVIDCGFNIGFSVLKITVLSLCKNYRYYLIIQLLQTICSNIAIQIFCQKNYVYIEKAEFDFILFKEVLSNVKNIFAGKIAGYIYGSTDNLIISSLLSTVKVGYLSNYTVFINLIKKIIGATFNAMSAIIGNSLLNQNEDKEETFKTYTYIRYFFASIIVIPWILFADDAVKILFGEQYLLSKWIVFFLGIDLYIHIIYTPCVEYINGQGFFSIDKNIALIGAIINIVISLGLVTLGGIEGVLFGTVLSQLFLWCGRSYVVYFHIFKSTKKTYIMYILKNAVWILIVLFQIVANLYIKILMNKDNYYIEIILNFIICEMINLLIHRFVLYKKYIK